MSTLLTGPLTDAEAAAAAGGAVVALIFSLVFYVIGCLGFMGIFKKAGQPGWAAFVPIWMGFLSEAGVGDYFDCMQRAGADRPAQVQCENDFRERVQQDYGLPG